MMLQNTESDSTIATMRNLRVMDAVAEHNLRRLRHGGGGRPADGTDTARIWADGCAKEPCIGKQSSSSKARGGRTKAGREDSHGKSTAIR